MQFSVQAFLATLLSVSFAVVAARPDLSGTCHIKSSGADDPVLWVLMTHKNENREWHRRRLLEKLIEEELIHEDESTSTWGSVDRLDGGLLQGYSLVFQTLTGKDWNRVKTLVRDVFKGSWEYMDMSTGEVEVWDADDQPPSAEEKSGEEAESKLEEEEEDEEEHNLEEVRGDLKRREVSSGMQRLARGIQNEDEKDFSYAHSKITRYPDGRILWQLNLFRHAFDEKVSNTKLNELRDRLRAGGLVSPKSTYSIRRMQPHFLLDYTVLFWTSDLGEEEENEVKEVVKEVLPEDWIYHDPLMRVYTEDTVGYDGFCTITIKDDDTILFVYESSLFDSVAVNTMHIQNFKRRLQNEGRLSTDDTKSGWNLDMFRAEGFGFRLGFYIKVTDPKYARRATTAVKQAAHYELKEKWTYSDWRVSLGLPLVYEPNDETYPATLFEDDDRPTKKIKTEENDKIDTDDHEMEE